jgi:hypothetical protein
MEKAVILTAVATALQRFIEIIIDPLVEKISPEHKKLIISIIALLIGEIIAFNGGLDLFEGKLTTTLGHIITGFVISGGTEFINSVLKILGYKKEEVKEKLK